MTNLSRFDARGNNRKFKFNFKKSNAAESNLIVITEEKYQELYLELKKIKPFFDSEDRKLVKVKNKITSIKLGIDDQFRKTYGFSDVNLSFNTRDLVEQGYLEEIVDYPFSFNYDNFFTMTNRIDVFSNISKIQKNESTIDSLKGFSCNLFGHSRNAFGENIQVKKNFRKDEGTVSNYEDNIISEFLTVNKEKQIVDKIIRNINPISRETTNRVIIKKKNVISSDVRYFVKKESNIVPFEDKSSKDNSSKLLNRQNLFVFTDETINNKILENRLIDDAIEESNIYMPAGKRYDHSLSNGRSSLLFSEGID